MEAIISLIKQGYSFQIINGEIQYSFLKSKEETLFHKAQVKRTLLHLKECANYINTLVTITIDCRFYVHIEDCRGQMLDRYPLCHYDFEVAGQEIRKQFLDNPKYAPIIIRHYKKSRKYVIISQDLEILERDKYKYFATEVQQASVFD